MADGRRGRVGVGGRHAQHPQAAPALPVGCRVQGDGVPRPVGIASCEGSVVVGRGHLESDGGRARLGRRQRVAGSALYSGPADRGGRVRARWVADGKGGGGADDHGAHDVAGCAAVGATCTCHLHQHPEVQAGGGGGGVWQLQAAADRRGARHLLLCAAPGNVAAGLAAARLHNVRHVGCAAQAGVLGHSELRAGAAAGGSGDHRCSGWVCRCEVGWGISRCAGGRKAQGSRQAWRQSRQSRRTDC